MSEREPRFWLRPVVRSVASREKERLSPGRVKGGLQLSLNWPAVSPGDTSRGPGDRGRPDAIQLL